MESHDIDEVVLKCIQETLRNEEVIIDHAIDLMEVGLDSMNFIRLIVLLEDEFEIEIMDDDISLENFQFLESISALISKYIAAE